MFMWAVIGVSIRRTVQVMFTQFGGQFMRCTLALFFLMVVVGLDETHAQWTRITGVPARDISAIIIRNGTIYAGNDSAVYASSNGGVTWERSASLPGEPSLIDALEILDGTIYAGTGSKGIYRSTNNGDSWEETNAGLTGLGSRSISAFAVRGNTLYVGTNGAGVFRLQQNAWGPYGDLSGVTAGNVTYLAAKGDTLVAGAGGNGVFWIAPPGSNVWSGFVIAPLQGEPLLVNSLVRLGSELIAGTTYGVYRSADEGATWLRSGAGGPGGGRIVKLALVANALYAASIGADTRMYRSDDGGYTWTRLENTTGVYAIAAEGKRLYAGRLDGLWYRNADPTSVDPTPGVAELLALEQNYPNPFNPATRIEFSLRSAGIVHVGVYDVLGRSVATLVEEERPAGTHSVLFDASGLASGVYIYRLSSGGMNISKRMLLMK